MDKVRSDFYLLRAALKRERSKNKELAVMLQAERERASALERQLEEGKNSLSAALAELDDSECLAKRQIDELAAIKRERNELADSLDHLKGDGLWELVSGNSEIKNKVICEYLKALPSGISLLGSMGYAALTPVHKPKDLADAKRIAEKIIKE